MHLPHLLALPPAIIALCATTPVLAAEESQWPHNVPRHLKYFPEDEVHAKRALSVKQRLQHEKPIGVRKMSMDEGEMFMLDNWIFASQDTPSQPQSARDSDYDVFGNVTSRALSPLRPLAQSDWLARMHIRDILMNRQFRCPEGTASCENIGAPDVSGCWMRCGRYIDVFCPALHLVIHFNCDSYLHNYRRRPNHIIYDQHHC
ncbi:hypothetical protein ACET3X_003789 [Alternaria dauci]|uniref:Uncharacterized protein n=1 Tax=Alternaria dauci TaxID=48095 RepID=A0ABR3UL36_9PLEO